MRVVWRQEAEGPSGGGGDTNSLCGQSIGDSVDPSVRRDCSVLVLETRGGIQDHQGSVGGVSEISVVPSEEGSLFIVLETRVG